MLGRGIFCGDVDPLWIGTCEMKEGFTYLSTTVLASITVVVHSGSSLTGWVLLDHHSSVVHDLHQGYQMV